jgi:hypothetical protein
LSLTAVIGYDVSGFVFGAVCQMGKKKTGEKARKQENICEKERQDDYEIRY